jgi:hypothetical protein
MTADEDGARTMTDECDLHGTRQIFCRKRMGEMMKLKQVDTELPDPETPAARRPDEAIARRLLDGLGRPADLRGVQVRHLWGERYRVNVIVGPESANVTVAHSYFLVADADGNIIDSTPAITKVYPRTPPTTAAAGSALPTGGDVVPPCMIAEQEQGRG